MTVPVTKRADQLVVGDRIPDDYLPHRFNKGPAEVRFVADDGEKHTFFAFRYPNGQHDSTTVLSESMLQVYPAPDPLGLGYSRADDAETTQPIAGRVPPHFEDGRAPIQIAGGHVVHQCCGKVDDAPHRSFCPQYRPTMVSEGGRTAVQVAGGFIEVDPPVVRCATSDPHGPHLTTFAPEMGIANGRCPGVSVEDDGCPRAADGTIRHLLECAEDSELAELDAWVSQPREVD